jgi:hypothetical protein
MTAMKLAAEISDAISIEISSIEEHKNVARLRRVRADEKMLLVNALRAMTTTPSAKTMLELADRIGKDIACTRTYSMKEWAIIEAALRSPAPSVGVGVQLVPKQPTPDMRIAGGIAWVEVGPTSETYVDNADACYKAMLAAAPVLAPSVGVDVREALEACREYLVGITKPPAVGMFTGVISSYHPCHALIDKIDGALKSGAQK